MKPTALASSTTSPQANFKVRKEPFGLSLSKPLACGTKASTSSALPFDKLRSFDGLTMHGPFDKLRANGGAEPTVVDCRNGPKAEARFTSRVVRRAVKQLT